MLRSCRAVLSGSVPATKGTKAPSTLFIIAALAASLRGRDNMSHSYRAADWAALILGGLMTVFGLILAGGGTWLLFLGGSFYYLSAGIALIVSGCLLIRRRVEGAWLY